MSKEGILLLVTGFYGAGKTTLAHSILGNDLNFEYVMTFTTRPRRDDDGDIEYRFVSEEEYDAQRSASDSWDHMDSKIHKYNYGADVSLVNSRRKLGLNQVCCIAPSIDIYNEMKGLYGGRVVLIVIDTPLELANKRLSASNHTERQARAFSPYQTNNSLDKLKTKEAFIFHPVGDIFIDSSTFKQTIEDILRS